MGFEETLSKLLKLSKWTVLILIILVILYVLIRDDTVEQIDLVVDKANTEMKYFEITKNQAPSVLGRNSRANYTISLKPEYQNSTYFFDKYKYTIVTGGDFKEIYTSDLCDFIKEKSREKNVVSRILDKLETTFSIGEFVKLEINNVNEVVDEAIAATGLIAAYNPKKTEIFVKGYADGSERNWSRPLIKEYYYNSIIVYPPTDINTFNPVEYSRNEKVIEIENGEYSNEHLPNLRAKFVLKDFIKPFIKKCLPHKKIDTYILEGFEFPDPKIPAHRKVDIYVYIY